jgi:phage baseplate assembly protein W
VTRRPGAAELDRVLTLLGTDLALDYPGPSGWFEDADLAVRGPAGRLPATVDLAVVARTDAADQLLVNRLKTQKGELADLGHPEYGSRHHELVGEPNVERTRNLVKLHVLEALSHEPRIAEIVDCTVRSDPRQRDVVRIEVVVRLHREPHPRNLVVPFSLLGPGEEAVAP